MFRIINAKTNEVLGEAETIEAAWSKLAYFVEEANKKKVPLEWTIYDTTKGFDII